MKKSKELIKNHFLEFKILLSILILLIIVGIVVDSINPYLYGKIIDSVIKKDLLVLKREILFFLGVSVLVQILAILETTLGRIVTVRIENRLKTEFYELVLAMNCKVQDKYMGGELLNRLEFEVATIIDYYIDLISSSLMIAFNFLISLFFLVKISKELTAIAVLLFPMSYMVNLCAQKRIRQIQQIQKKFSDKYYSFLNECLNNLKGIKAFQVELKYKNKFCELLSENYDISMKSMNLNNLISFIRSMINEGLNIVILFISALIIMKDKMTIGNMVAFNTYLGKLFTAISKVMELNVQKQNVTVSFERLEELLVQGNDEKEERYVGQELNAIREIEFKNVTFRYEIKNVLKEFNLLIGSYGLYSIVGKNGSGKSTVLRLLENFYSCSEGSIIINGVDICVVKTSQLRQQIGYLAKEPFVINDSVYNNLQIGNSDITMEEIVEACRIVGLHQDIVKWEKGYNTFLGEGGSRLSSGQKQKLGLARVLLRKVSLILLDEVTSDLDGEVEKQICQVIKELSKSKIILNIAHRLEIVQHSDRVILIDEGKVMAEGSPTKLEKECSYYQKLFTNH